jgi:hypothetical protein
VNYFKVGCNFTYELIEYLANANRMYPTARVAEVYGSRAESSYLSARPKFRIPDLSKKEFEIYVKKLNDIETKYNYTLNANSIGSKKYISDHESDIKVYIRFLCDCNVDTITVSLPLMAEYI